MCRYEETPRVRLDVDLGAFQDARLGRSEGKDPERMVERSFKVPGRRLSDPPISVRELKNYRDWAYALKIRHSQEYERFCHSNLPGRAFIYFALHYQPERTTVPEGGIFSDMYRCAWLLSSIFGDRYAIVIKEHPSQFNYSGMGEQSRWIGYYEDFGNLKNVFFVSNDVPSMDLIDKSSAVATVTGMVGWEALCRGKPVLVFGSPWYIACRGALSVKNVSQAEEAKSLLDNGFQPSWQEVRAYAASLEACGEKVFVSPTVKKGFTEKVDVSERLKRLVLEGL
jgi:hypothetical protein